MPVPRLTDSERETALAALPDWTLREDGLAITRRFIFHDFGEAFAFTPVEPRAAASDT